MNTNELFHDPAPAAVRDLIPGLRPGAMDMNSGRTSEPPQRLGFVSAAEAREYMTGEDAYDWRPSPAPREQVPAMSEAGWTSGWGAAAPAWPGARPTTPEEDEAWLEGDVWPGTTPVFDAVASGERAQDAHLDVVPLPNGKFLLILSDVPEIPDDAVREDLREQAGAAACLAFSYPVTVVPTSPAVPDVGTMSAWRESALRLLGLTPECPESDDELRRELAAYVSGLELGREAARARSAKLEAALVAVREQATEAPADGVTTADRFRRIAEIVDGTAS